jgi:hypothetical protein
MGKNENCAAFLGGVVAALLAMTAGIHHGKIIKRKTSAGSEMFQDFGANRSPLVSLPAVGPPARLFF